MRFRAGQRSYRCVDAALLRSAIQPGETVLPPWPVQELGNGTVAEGWRDWLRLVWSDSRVAAAVEIASPLLSRRIEEVIAGRVVDSRQARRMALSLARYMLRAGSRSTPYGLFAGVAPARFAAASAMRFGQQHRARVRPDARWLDTIVSMLESDPVLLDLLTVTANTLRRGHGDRLTVIPAPLSGLAPSTAEVSLRLTPAVAVALDVAQSPIRCAALAEKLAAEFPAAPIEKINQMIVNLVGHRVLISVLRAPFTIDDSLGHLLVQLEIHRAGDLEHLAPAVEALRDLHTRIQTLGRVGFDGQGRGLRDGVIDRMGALAPVCDAPLAVDLLLDADVTVPEAVARDIEIATTGLARLAAHPHGTPAWRDYAERFRARYGAGALVPVVELTDPCIGLGYPAGYPDAGAQTPPSRSVRDERLLSLAQLAAVEGRREVVLTEAMLAELMVEDPAPVQLPPHLEVCVQIHAASRAALTDGEYTVRVLGVSRAAGTMTGRFLHLLEAVDRARMTEAYAALPTMDAGATPVHLSFPPLGSRADHVTRVPGIWPSVISLGEYPAPATDLIGLEDLAVGCDERRMYLASLSTGRVLEPVAPSALNFYAHTHTPPLARFLAEISRAATSQVTSFDWGAAACLAFLPGLRYGRTVLSPARWKLGAREMPGTGQNIAVWTEELRAWRRRRRVPARVLLAEGDRHLLLDLRQPAHLELLRTHLSRTGQAVLIEAPPPDGNGWIGGRAHSLVVPLASTRPAALPVIPRRPTVLRRDHGNLPGVSRYLVAELFVPIGLQDVVLATHLPQLLASFDPDAHWWFERHDGPEPRLRLSIALSSPDQFGSAARALGRWAAGLRNHELLHHLQLTNYWPHPGQWGEGEALSAAEGVFHADSHVVMEQFGAPHTVNAAVLAAANLVAVATGFTGSAKAGMRWLARHVHTTPTPVPRSLHTEAVRLAQPANDFAALHAALSSASIAASWPSRAEALGAYRAGVSEETGTGPDAILTALLHLHCVRALGLDREKEGTSLRLARAAALAYLHTGERS